MEDKGKVSDELVSLGSYNRDTKEEAMVTGHGEVLVRGADGEVKQRIEFDNLVTDRGDQYYGALGAGAAETAATGMRLGTGTTAVAKNGAGAAIVTYVTGSSIALDSAPATSDKGAGAGYRISYVTTWAAGVATSNDISEVVITNESPLTDVAGVEADTISRALLSPTVNKGSGDTLEVTWHHDLLGA